MNSLIIVSIQKQYTFNKSHGLPIDSSKAERSFKRGDWFASKYELERSHKLSSFLRYEWISKSFLLENGFIYLFIFFIKPFHCLSIQSDSDSSNKQCLFHNLLCYIEWHPRISNGFSYSSFFDNITFLSLLPRQSQIPLLIC